MAECRKIGSFTFRVLGWVAKFISCRSVEGDVKKLLTFSEQGSEVTLGYFRWKTLEIEGRGPLVFVKTPLCSSLKLWVYNKTIIAIEKYEGGARKF